MLDQLMLFAGDTHASPLVWPGSEKARQMTAISGRNLCGSWLNSGPLGLLEKTLLGTSAWGSMTCFLTWKPKATPAGRLLFQLAPSMPLTGETGSGLWPTATAQDNIQLKQPGTKRGTTLGGAARFWQTPVADDAVERAAGKFNSRGEPKLSAQVKLWPTPTASDSTGAQPNTGRTGGESLRECFYPTPAAQDGKNSTMPPSQHDRGTVPGAVLRSGRQGQLNAEFVEWMMGFERGFTDLHADIGELPCSSAIEFRPWPDGAGISPVATGVPDRNARIKALGNAVVPQVVAMLGRAIMAANEKQEAAA